MTPSANIQVIVPMSGFGERFRRAGYTVPKPMIEVEGKPIVAHVVDMFPGVTDIVFVCNQDHLDNPEFGMAEALKQAAPTGTIVGIAPHKLGPIHAVLQALPALDLSRPVVVNYCDFTCYWDFEDFAQFVEETGCAGCIPCYRGFHPHSLGSTFYAYVKQQGLMATDIQEKQPWTDEPIKEFASSGSYYFRTAKLMRDAFRETMERELMVGGEYYVSMAYKPLFEKQLPVTVYELQHFMQWGTPEDLQEYQLYSKMFRDLVSPTYTVPEQSGALVIPAAGLGSRFSKEGYTLPKPLVPVSGRPMLNQAIADLPKAASLTVVLREDLPMLPEVEAALQAEYPQVQVLTLSELTDGQARTCLLGVEDIEDDTTVTFGTCDNGVLYSAAEFERYMVDDNIDVLVWGFRGHPSARRRPEQFGWIAADEQGAISQVSVKQPLANPERDPIVLGAVTFKRVGDFKRAVARMIERDAKVNGEFYLDTCINDAIALGLNCQLLDVDDYLGWGTPDELKTYEYWQSCFDKWPGHPYSLQQDARVNQQALEALRTRFAKRVPARPE